MDNHLPEREREKERECAVKKNFSENPLVNCLKFTNEF